MALFSEQNARCVIFLIKFAKAKTKHKRMTKKPAHIHVSIPKDKLGVLPAASFRGKIRVIEREEDVEEAVKDLIAAGTVGFDTETRPSFRKGQNHNVALIQLSTHTTCYLFRINRCGFSEHLVSLLQNPEVLKIGLSIHDDFHNLQKISPIEPENFIDLQTYVKDYGILDNSLSKIYAILFGQRVSKGQRLTNWEAEHLTGPQQAYAALDALACLEIYDYLEGGRFDAGTSPYQTQPEE